MENSAFGIEQIFVIGLTFEMAAIKSRATKKDEELNALTKQLEEAKKGSAQSTHEISMKYDHR